MKTLFKKFYSKYKVPFNALLIYLAIPLVLLVLGFMQIHFAIILLVDFYLSLTGLILGPFQFFIFPLLFLLQYIHMPDILSYILILIFTATLLLVVFTLIYHLYISVKNIKDIRKKFIVIILLIIALIIYFPKPAGERKFNGNEKPQFTVKDCGCAGYNMQMGGKGSQIWQYKMYCYGIPLSCREYNQNHADLFKDE